MSRLLALPATLGLMVLSAATAPAAEARTTSPEEKALQTRAKEFVAAFNKGDALALAAFWTPDGDFMDVDGRCLKGRKAIEETYKTWFSHNRGAKLAMTITGVRVVKPDLAIEDGVSEVRPADGGPPEVARYTVVHVKQDNRWLLASVRMSAANPPSHSEHLEALAWLVGEWTDDVEKGPVARASYSWAENQNFLVSSLATTLKDIPVAGGTQWIGWDATAKQIRSWTFDSSGGFGEGVWTQDGNRWTIKTTTNLRDGKKISAVNLVTRVDHHHLTWQSTKRSLDGKPLPDTEVVKMKRVLVDRPVQR